MKFKELKDKGPEELTKLLAETRDSVRAMRAGIAASQQPKVRLVRVAKRTIARILTVLNVEPKKS